VSVTNHPRRNDCPIYLYTEGTAGERHCAWYCEESGISLVNVTEIVALLNEDELL
jgi:hypothetical protein